MDVTTLRSIITVLCLLAYIAIVLWAYSSRQQSRFEQAANLPFADDDVQQQTVRTLHGKADHTQEKAHG